jgi:hypothetical protein
MGFVFFRHGQGWKKSYPAKVNPKNIIYFFHITQSFFGKNIVTPFAMKLQLGNEGCTYSVSFSRAKRRTNPLIP